MKLISTTDCLGVNFGEEQAIRLLAQAGFDGIDWSFYTNMNEDSWWNQVEWKARAVQMKQCADEAHIQILQAHAPFHTTIGEEHFDCHRKEQILRSMEIASIMGVENIIVHPVQHLPYKKYKQELFDMNVAFYQSLIPYCEKWNIHVCVENMWQYDDRRKVIVDSVCAQPEEFCAMLDVIDSPWIGGCLDIGHCAVVGCDPVDMIHTLGGKRLRALHVHDVDHIHDNHSLPFVQKLDWAAITKALGEVNYKGDFTFEADGFMKPFPPELQPDVCVLMERTGRYLIRGIEEARR